VATAPTGTLHEALGLKKRILEREERVKGDVYKLAQRAALFFGMSRTYAPSVDGGDQLAGEKIRIQQSVDDLIAQFAKATAAQVDAAATVDLTNAKAVADVIVDGTVLARNVPGVTLLYWQDLLDAAKAFLEKVPLLPPEVGWNPDPANDWWQSDPTESDREVKVEDFRIVVPQSDKHPAQVAQVNKNVKAGTWTVVRYSRAMDAHRHRVLTERVNQLWDAVTVARARANSTPLVQAEYGTALTGWLFRE
jgi:hypothetical protein